MKPSEFISARQTREILRAGRHSWKIERPLNIYVVINFDPKEGDELAPQRKFRRIRRKCQSWLYYKRKNSFIDPLTDVRTWENKQENIHVNWAIHIPEKYIEEFEDKLSKWIEKEINIFNGNEYKITRIYNVNGLLRYILKGSDPNKAGIFEIRHSKQGKIWGRRAVASTCLGKAARERDRDNGMILEGR